MIISAFDRVENIVGKGENAGYQHLLLFPQCFEKASFSDTSKGVIVWEFVKINKIIDSYGLCQTRSMRILKLVRSATLISLVMSRAN